MRQFSLECMPAYNKKVSVPGKSAQELYDKIAMDIDQLVSKWGLPNAKLTRDAAKRQIHLKAPMVEAVLSCVEGEVRLDAQLGLLAMPFRSKIDEQVDKWVGRNFPA
jgi:hypothetical protein